MTPLTPDEAKARNVQPLYWRDETSGRVAAAVRAYVDDPARMTPDDVAVMRIYVRQWITAPVWSGEEIEHLRATVDMIASGAALEAWLRAAGELGVDPL